jgi:hypothetical protein
VQHGWKGVLKRNSRRRRGRVMLMGVRMILVKVRRFGGVIGCMWLKLVVDSVPRSIRTHGRDVGKG